MKIQTLASGSHGNCYYINDGSSSVLLECGIPFKKIQRGLDFKTSALSGCLVTHEHSDHALAVKDMVKAGINCYMSAGTARAIGINNHRIKVVQAEKPFPLGSWTILPFDVKHDTLEPFGYLADSRNGVKLLFVTDTAYIEGTFQGLTHILIECNYSLDIIREKMRYGETHAKLKNRVLHTHMGIGTLVEMLNANDLSKVQEIHLLHLSDRNSSELNFKQEIQRLTGKVVYCH